MVRPGTRADLPGGVTLGLRAKGDGVVVEAAGRLIEGAVLGLATEAGAAWWAARDGSWVVVAGVEGRAAVAVADVSAGEIRTVAVMPRASAHQPVGPEYVRYADDGAGGVLVIFDIGVARIDDERKLRWLTVHDDGEARPEEVTSAAARFASPHGDFAVAVADGAVTLDDIHVVLCSVEGFGTVWAFGLRARRFGTGRSGLRWEASLSLVADRASSSHAVVWLWHGEAVEGVRLQDGGRVPGPVPCDRCEWPAPPEAMIEVAIDEDRLMRLLQCRSCGALYEVDMWNDRHPPLLLTEAEAKERYRGAL